MAGKLKVKVEDYAPQFLQYAKRGFNKSVFQNLTGALHALAIAYQEAWINFAYGHMTVPGSKTIHSSGPYAQSIQIDESLPFTRIIFTDFPPHQYIESGHPKIDLKPGLLRGKSARQGKFGPYNIVSYRHFTREDIPGAGSSKGYVPKRKNVMPMSIQRMMQGISDKADADKTGPGGRSRQLTSGAKPADRSYQWGARLDSASKIGQRSKLGSRYTWKAGKYASMVRMDASSGSKENRTQYRTFRVVSWRSPPNSWIVPAADPIPIRQAVIDYVDQQLAAAGHTVQSMLGDAIQKDII